MAQEVATPLGEGRYRLLAVIGEGGMATVYGAWDDRLGVHRAVKVLNPVLANHESIRRRFDIEARTMARLHHPNIVTVHDVGTDGGRAYIVMELVGGGNLMRRVELSGPLPPRMACSAMGALLSALKYAHDHNVVHRDIKPHNVLLTTEGLPKVTDFGIARVSDIHHSLTRTGSTMGTPAYMAPEQRDDAGHVDGRADIFSAGATLFTLVSGREPFDIYAVEHQARLLAGIPSPIADIIRKATRYSPAERYPDAAAMAADLARVSALMPPDADDAPPLPVDEPEPWRQDISLYGAQATTPPEISSVPPRAPDAFPSLPGDLVAPLPPLSSQSLPLDDLGHSEPYGLRQAVRSGWFWGIVAMSVVSTLGVMGTLRWMSRANSVNAVGDVPTVQLGDQNATATDPPVDAAAGTGDLATTGATDASATDPAAAGTAAAGTDASGSARKSTNGTRTTGATTTSSGTTTSTPPATTTSRPRTTAAPDKGTGLGTLVITSKPTRAAVFLDNKYQGETKWEGSAPAGLHRLILESEDAGRHEEAIQVPADKETRICWDFLKDAACKR